MLHRGGSAGLMPGAVPTEAATPMLPMLPAAARALLSTVDRSSPAAAAAPATYARQVASQHFVLGGWHARFLGCQDIWEMEAQADCLGLRGTHP